MDLTTATLFEIANSYSEVFMTLHDPIIAADVVVDFTKTSQKYSAYVGTLASLLSIIPSTDITVIPALPNLAVKYVKYAEASQNGYVFDVTKIGYNLPSNYPVEFKTDLIMSRPNTPTLMSMIHTHSLVTVNGYLHLTDTDNTNAYIYGGGKTMLKSKDNHVGILSFIDIGTVTKIPITTSNVSFDTSNPSYTNRLLLTIPESIDNQTVMMSVGGYLVTVDPNIFFQLNANTFVFNIEALPLLARLVESNNDIDLSSLNLAPGNLPAPGAISATVALSQASILAYMTLIQSFFILINNSKLVIEPYYVNASGAPGEFTSYVEPCYPLMVNYGKMAEYWVNNGASGEWRLTVTEPMLQNFTFLYEPTANLTTINDSLVPLSEYKAVSATMLKIHT
jgi:hypothetical protein